MMGRTRTIFWTRCAPLWLVAAHGQMFEIPAEMLQGIMGGMMGGGGGGGPPPTEWPKTENSEIAAEYDWLVNTEWKGRTAKYMFLRDGFIESSLKECEPEGQCLWAANNGRVLLNTPTLKVIKFKIEGLDQVDRKKLDNKDEAELKRIKLVAEKAGKTGKKSQLEFEKVATAGPEDNLVTKDLYKLLEIEEDADASAIKSKFRRLSISNHPDKGGDPQVFNEMREAYEILSDPDNRRYYDLGGVQLVKNIENSWKEVEGQKAQLDAQLAKVPRNHPQRSMFEAQVEQQRRQFEKSRIKPEIESKLRSEDLEVMVPIAAQELYEGVSRKTFEFKRLVLCRGCRSDPSSPACADCGRCPPEKVQVPKYGMTPFGRQVIGIREKEQESRERCREVIVPIENLRVPKGAKQDAILKTVHDIGHQTPGKLPGKVVLKVQRGSQNDTYTIAEADLHTVLHISLEKALFGFEASWKHLGGEQVTIGRKNVTKPNEVIRLKGKGLVGDDQQRGDLFIRLAVDMPSQLDNKQGSLTFQAPTDKSREAKLEPEAAIELRDGMVWRRWTEREKASKTKTATPKKKEEL
mmetsp:Transcript_54441/g.129740  ORF Transcript_54441/g.129740 Transcript_54441/m.129740 type:complete len:577 (+) Transcript_54441:40-1770(+)